VPTDLGQIITEVIEQFAVQAERKELTVRWQAPQNPAVLADTTQVKRVLGNLLHNAIKFTPAGGSIR